METERDTALVRNAAAHSYQPIRRHTYLEEDQTAEEAPSVVTDLGSPVGTYQPLPPHVQE